MGLGYLNPGIQVQLVVETITVRHSQDIIRWVLHLHDFTTFSFLPSCYANKNSKIISK